MGVLRFGCAFVNFRFQHWGNTTLSGGLRRISWRSKEKAREPTTRKRTCWEGRCLSWTQKVKQDGEF